MQKMNVNIISTELFYAVFICFDDRFVYFFGGVVVSVV